MYGEPEYLLQPPWPALPTERKLMAKTSESEKVSPFYVTGNINVNGLAYIGS